ncbi:3-dehydroquinate dehydratase [Psychrosphaera saromensis]|uniref:3-dehydroquinate dehydratase n=1 Tax=Psychrosphaera saromensis TaxID=716813 RepID=A0A2S7USM6_9GAMM|nr:type II 3-dehydroquinate dehydratase [Psychrosphaera saromensis]PQJ52996.1 type II 3-dehydroquinate dehydratase [Psychrosphaera saromensis]GHB77356.1 3-dehydroquinate dehydratase [Psychrosphaera saromensis]GLQ12841.1 3-dehydroquinate dehydratase [Psychrosphaera saromensis]
MTTNSSVLLLNGPNLNLLGKREPEIYGAQSLDQLVGELKAQASAEGVQLTHTQSNSEAELIDVIHQAMGKIDFIIFNPAAFTHTSVALRDALLGVNIPFIEIHISNVHAREDFRHKSFLSDIAQGVICGLGTDGYRYALTHAISHLSK